MASSPRLPPLSFPLLRRAWLFLYLKKRKQNRRRHKIHRKYLLTIIVRDEQVEPVIDAIIQGARTGKIGDGKIFVSALEEVVRIRTGEIGVAAS